MGDTSFAVRIADSIYSQLYNSALKGSYYHWIIAIAWGSSVDGQQVLQPDRWHSRNPVSIDDVFEHFGQTAEIQLSSTKLILILVCKELQRFSPKVLHKDLSPRINSFNPNLSCKHRATITMCDTAINN